MAEILLRTTIAPQIERISFAHVLGDPDAEQLIAEYAAECSIAEVGIINPQRDIYALLEANGTARCFGAYYGSMLVGFANVLVSVLPHYGKKVATIESIFVSKHFRRTGAGSDLLDAIQAHAKEAGCVGVLYSAPAGGRFELLLAFKKGIRRTNAVFFGGFD